MSPRRILPELGESEQRQGRSLILLATRQAEGLQNFNGFVDSAHDNDPVSR
jgi:hypothetical protein